MRKFVQKQVLELISMVGEGVAYAVSSDTTPSSAATVLDDCCTAVLAIDQSLTSGLSAERYSFYKQLNHDLLEMLQHLLKTVIHNESDAASTKKIENQLGIINTELIHEAEVKLEIIFLPYKASMWDSLESIWRAAHEDPCCDCYVIPIPYYDRTPDGGASEFHYEGEDFPSDVPITDFNSYSLSTRRPDVIYIHNPFDQYNRVTTVHPHYYSSELKKNTDMLVYVPYYVMGGGISASQFNMLPVYQNMDRMIVQSEKYKQLYSVMIPENKLLVMGSPKVDRMINSNLHKPSVPEEWIGLMKDKKVVMYNISIAGILQYGIQAIKKMKYVFSRFNERNDVVLLWRPHPLIEPTLKSMNPSLLEIYHEMKEQFIDNNWGIYDTTPDITAAVAWSDAYIGEETSSVVHLFGVVGKPIFLMKMEYDHAPTDEDRTSLTFFDGYFEGNTVWFAAHDFNTLCKMNLGTGKTEVIAKLPSSNAKYGQYCDILKIGDKVVVQPLQSSNICEYDLQEKRLKITPLPDPVAPNFDRMVRYRDHLFIKPNSYPAILQYEIETGVFKFHRNWIDEFSNNDNAAMFAWALSVKDSSLLMGSSFTNKVLEFNMETGRSKTHVVGSEGMNYFGMTFDGSDYWLIPNEGKTIVKWNYETGETTEYTNYPEGFVGETRGFVGIVCCGHYLLAFPREANMIVRIERTTGKMSEFKIDLPYKEGQRKSCYPHIISQYYFVKKIDEKRVAALTAYDSSLLIIDTETLTYSIKSCRLNIEEAERYMAMEPQFRSLNDNIPYACSENQFLSLDRFIDQYIVDDQQHDTHTQKQAYSSAFHDMNGTCGVHVHQYIKEQLLPYEI